MCILIQNELGYKILELYYLCKVYELFKKNTINNNFRKNNLFTQISYLKKNITWKGLNF